MTARTSTSPCLLPTLLVVALLLAVPAAAGGGDERSTDPDTTRAASSPTAAAVTTVYVVRHAEKMDASADPELTDAGRARASELARVLADDAVDAVYTTPFLRTRETARPVAEAAGVELTEYDPRDSAALAEAVLARHAGGRVVVVGHSNTVDDLAAAFGAAGLSDLDESEYDHLFVVHRWEDGTAHLDRLRYGAP